MCIHCGADDPDLCPHGLLARIEALEAEVRELQAKAANPPGLDAFRAEGLDKVNAEPPRGANGEAWSAWRRMEREV